MLVLFVTTARHGTKLRTSEAINNNNRKKCCALDRGDEVTLGDRGKLLRRGWMEMTNALGH